MGNNQTEKAFEEKRLAQTISLAEEQLKQAKEAADKKKSEIIEAKKDVRENTEHGITSLYTSDGFEALVELSQYINPVTDKIIDYEEEEHKILLLEKMIKSPYFARIDFKFGLAAPPLSERLNAMKVAELRQLAAERGIEKPDDLNRS